MSSLTYKLYCTLQMHFRVDDPAAMESRQYYNIAHSFQEDITEQPSILVGGHLKEYQVCLPLYYNLIPTVFLTI